MTHTDNRNISHPILRLWHKYKLYVQKVTCPGLYPAPNQPTEWRSQLFTNFITFLLPVCLIALVPGVIVAFKYQYKFIGIYALSVAMLIAVVALNVQITVTLKKYLVFGISYSLGIVLLIVVGQFGIGLIYLLALSIIVTLVFSRTCSYCTVGFNIVLSIFCAFVIYFKLFNSPLVEVYDLYLWIGAASNFIFLNIVCVLLINTTINILEKAILVEKATKTELHQTNEELIEWAERYKTLFLQSPLPMWVLDRETLKFLQVNDAALQNYGYTKEEFLSIRLSDIKLEEDMGVFYENTQISQKAGTLIHDITRHKRKNGDIFHVEIMLNSIQLGGKIASLVIARDISQHIRHTNAIELQNKKLREIAYIQSHFVRAPLARILGLVDLITDENKITDPELISYLDQSAKELDDIVKKITNNTVDI